MIINKDSLRRDTIALIRDIDAQIEEVEERADVLNIAPEKVCDGNGSYYMSPLLLAKAQAYNTLVLLQT